jgi:hypothetical protein
VWTDLCFLPDKGRKHRHGRTAVEIQEEVAIRQCAVMKQVERLSPWTHQTNYADRLSRVDKNKKVTSFVCLSSPTLRLGISYLSFWTSTRSDWTVGRGAYGSSKRRFRVVVALLFYRPTQSTRHFDEYLMFLKYKLNRKKIDVQNEVVLVLRAGLKFAWLLWLCYWWYGILARKQTSSSNVVMFALSLSHENV